MKEYRTILKEQFNNAIDFKDKAKGVTKVFLPFFHEDGDMFDIFIEQLEDSTGLLRICDYGMTLMRLSYSFDIDTENKKAILDQLIKDNLGRLDNGNMYIETDIKHIYDALMQYSQLISKVSNMDILKRENVRSLFYDMLREYIYSGLKLYKPEMQCHPIANRKDLIVDCVFRVVTKPIYLFGVRDTNKAKETTICCLEFMQAKLPFDSLIVYEDFEALTAKDKIRLTNVADKQFSSLEDFKDMGPEYFKRKVS